MNYKRAGQLLINHDVNTMSYTPYERMGVTSPASRGFPLVPHSVEQSLADIPDDILVDILSLYNNSHYRGRNSYPLSAKRCFSVMGYPNWACFSRIAIGMGAGARAGLLTHYHCKVEFSEQTVSTHNNSLTCFTHPTH